MGIEFGQKGTLCLGEDTPEPTSGGDLAWTANPGVAIDDQRLALAEIDDVAEPDLVSGFGQPHSAATTTVSFEECLAG